MGSVFIGSSIFVEGSNLMRGLFTGNVDSLPSRDVMLLELLSPSGDLIVFSWNKIKQNDSKLFIGMFKMKQTKYITSQVPALKKK